MCVFLQDDEALASCELDYVMITELPIHVGVAASPSALLTFGLDTPLCVAVLCIVGSFAASLASTH